MLRRIKLIINRFFSPFNVLPILNKSLERELKNDRVDNAIWARNISRFEKDVEFEDVQFAFEQAEKLLKDSVEDSHQIVTRINIVMTICAGAFIFLGGHLGGILANKNFDHIRTVKIREFIEYHFTLIPAFFMAITFIYILLRLAYKLIFLEYYTVGSQPKQLFVRQYFKKDNSELPTIIKMYLGELEEYQMRITENRAKNKKQWTELNYLIYLATFATLEGGLVLLMQLLFII